MIEFINLPSMHHDPVVRSDIPSNITNFNFNVATVVCNLEKPFSPEYFILMDLGPALMLIDFFETILSFHVILKDPNSLTKTTNLS